MFYLLASLLDHFLFFIWLDDTCLGDRFCTILFLTYFATVNSLSPTNTMLQLPTHDHGASYFEAFFQLFCFAVNAYLCFLDMHGAFCFHFPAGTIPAYQRTHYFHFYFSDLFLRLCENIWCLCLTSISVCGNVTNFSYCPFEHCYTK